MPFFRKKPIVIEAMQFTAETYRQIMDWAGAKSGSEVRNCSDEHPDGFDYPTLEIDTLEGTMTASIGDWIIKGINGEFYPCKPDIFAETYEEATPKE